MSDDKRRPNPGTEPDLRASTPARLLSNVVGRGSSPERSASPSPQDASSSRQELDALRGREGQHGPAANLETRVVGSKPGVAPTEGLLAVGVQLQGRYKILGVIGVGGMGAVYRAQDLRFLGVTRLCAIKEMVNTATDPRVREMITRNFEREASILATLSHPAIPQVYDYFTEGSRSYLVLEFVEGQDLEARVSEAEGLLAEEQVVEWAIQLCEVLSYLHNRQPRPIIFRDLKPSNIMLDAHGRIRLVDFGIAKIFQSGEKGTMIGTEGYSPPEQYRGVAEPRGDVYALGATMHHLLSKQDPRLEPPFSFRERPIHRTNPTVSRELVEIVEKALQYDVNSRWGSAEEMRRALAARLPGRVAARQSDRTTLLTNGSIRPIWRFACEDEVRGSVIVANGVVLAPSYDHNLYAIDGEEGEFLWKFAAEGGIGATPCFSNNLVVIGTADHNVYGVSLVDGQSQWVLKTKGRVFSSAFAQFDHFFVGSDDANLYAIHGYSGRKAWNYTADGEVRSRPFVNDQMIVFSCNLGYVYALSLNRELRWRFQARRGILASPLVAEGLVLVGSLDWNFYALDARSGWLAWKHRTGGPVASTAGVFDGLVVFGSADGQVYALQLSDGRLVWRFKAPDQVNGAVTVYEGAVYAGCVDGALYCLDAHTGALRWRYQTDGAITGAPFALGGVIYVGSSDHYVYAIPA